jgi:hypothetical protein
MRRCTGIREGLLACAFVIFVATHAEAQTLDPLTEGICNGQIYSGTKTMAEGFKEMGLCTPSAQASAATAAKIAAIQDRLKNNTQMANNVAGLLLGIIQSSSDSSSNDPTDAADKRAAELAAAAAARRMQQAINEANEILQATSGLEAKNSAGRAGSAANATLNSLLAPSHPATTSDASVNKLLVPASGGTPSSSSRSRTSSSLNELLRNDSAATSPVTPH